jgi:hypothetical protein
MWDGFIGRRITGSAKGFQRFGMVSVLGGFLMVAGFTGTTLNLIEGPTPLDDSALASLVVPSFSQKYAIVQGNDPTLTGMTEEETRTTESGAVESKTTTADYILLIVGKHLLLVKAKPGDRENTYTGTVAVVPDDLRAALNRDLSGDPNVLSALLPVMLDTTNDYGDGVVPAGVFAGLLLLLGCWALLRSKRYKENPESHPICKNLSRYGPLYTLVPEIDEESKAAAAIGSVMLTRNWIISGSTVMLRAEIVWVYKKRTKHSVNFIPTHTTYAMVVCDSRGKRVEIRNSEQGVDGQLSGWGEQLPWVIFGFDAGIQKLYRKQLAVFAQTVSERKASLAVRR